MPVQIRLLSLMLFGATLISATPANGQRIACTGGTAGPYPCSNVDLEKVVSLNDLRTTATNDVWGWTDPSNDREYALAGTRSGTGFVDITDPDAPILLGKLLTSSGNSTWRDIKVYDNYAFVVSEAGSHGMQVFDLTQLRGLTEDADREFSEDVLYTGVSGNSVGGSHNIAINEGSGFAYIVGAGSCSGGLHMVNIQNPLSPTFAGCFSSDGYTHDVQCVNYTGPDTDHVGSEICVGSNEDTITTVDVTNKSNPVMLSRVSYPDDVYTHQGWFTEDQQFFLVDDESDAFVHTFPGSRTIVFDMTDLDSPDFDFFHYGTEFTATHNQYVRGQYVFQSNYESGLRILDITDIALGSLSEAGFFDTYPAGNDVSFEGQWSNYPFFPSEVIIATDQSNGLFIVKPTFPIVTNMAAPAETPGPGGYALSAAYPNPFADQTRLSISVSRAQHVTADVLDVTGRRISIAFDGTVGTDVSQTIDIAGTDLPVGLYLVHIRGEDFSTTRRISLVR